MINRISTLIILFLLAASVWGQNDTPDFLPQITPPSPEASALGNYGNIPVGEFTGAANIDIPLLTYKTKNLEMPISLYYGSNGIKVDDFGSNVGLGWNINMGGIITKTVRDENDGTSPRRLYPPNDMSGGVTNPLAMEFFQLGGQDRSDTESDFFTFNAGGYSGEFVYGQNGIIFTKPQKVIIEQLADENRNVYFIMTTPQGIKYHFTEIERNTFRTYGGGHQPPTSHETAWYLTKVVHPLGDEIYLEYDNNNKQFDSSLSQNLSYSFPAVQGDCYIDPTFGVISTIHTKQPTKSIIYNHRMIISGQRLKKVFSNNNKNGSILIDYNSTNADIPTLINSIKYVDEQQNLIEQANFNYNTTINKRDFLDEIIFKDITRKYSFEYIEPANFPKRLSKAQDHWGYYNGKSENQNIVPNKLPAAFAVSNIDYGGADKEPNWNFTKIGMLKKIYYPTKGYSEFDYEANSYWGTKQIFPDQQSVHLGLVVDDTHPFSSQDSKTITTLNEELIKITGHSFFNSQDCDESYYFPNGHKIHLSVTRTIDNSGVQLYTMDSFGHLNPAGSTYFSPGNSPVEVYFNSEVGESYTIKIYTNSDPKSACTNGSAIFKYYPSAIQEVEDNIETGGVRIKSTKDFSLVTNDEVYKRYHYGKLNSLNQSSGNKGSEPNYWDMQTIQRICGPGLKITNQVISSSSLITLFDSGRSNIYYPFVTISEGGDNFENGGVTKEFILNRDYWGNNLIGNDIKSAPWTNFGWDNGFEKKIQILKKNSNGGTPIIVQETQNVFVNDERDNFEDVSYAIRKEFDLVYQQDVTHTCTTEDANTEFLTCWTVCTTDHNHSTWIPSGDCIAFGANNVQQCLPNPCWQNEGTTLIYPNRIENLSVMEYKTFSHWSYLSESKTTVYDANGQNPILTETKYFYDNPAHLQLSRQETTSSLGETLRTEYYYPPDLTSSYEQSALMNKLVGRNQIASPVITKTFENGTPTAEERTHYAHFYENGNPEAGFILPQYVYAKRGEIGTTSLPADKKITYDYYDIKGNLTEYTLADGIPVSIIWGYNGQYPIAKVEGLRNNQISSYITTLQTASNGGTLSTTSFDALRTYTNSLANHAIVTGYVYKPLVGVTAIVQPNGQAEHYQYDSFGRLQEVYVMEYDTAGNPTIKRVIRKLEYNYKD